MFSQVKISPSILSADFVNLERDVTAIVEGGADYVHVDVMDGHFVPNLTIGVPVVKALKRISAAPLDVHLMISNPAIQVPWYLSAGADMVTIHVEADGDLASVITSIREAGASPAIALNPETPIDKLDAYLDMVDMVLVMSVHPGFGGQSFIVECVDKVAALSQKCKERGLSPLIEIDGGVNVDTVVPMAAAGADVIVCGSAIFAQDDPVASMEAIRAAATKAQGQ